ncbi:DUF429 domain-containing protein [Haloplanus salilacus]|uniref:DUF429 domain-containing protein n=1 Tax=Haloplanus salilacus TaxID=2949994 RepID=UPI0030D15DD8
MTARPNDSFVGVDACSGGWFATILSDDGVSTSLYNDFGNLVEDNGDALQVLVDIPIGLPTEERRKCDEQAKELLGCRGITAFYPPCKNALDSDDYKTASTAHEEAMDHGLSRQAYNIGDAIQDVAAVVGNEYDGVIRESHPELCFYALNGQPIAYSKSSERGQAMRTQLLRNVLNGMGAVRKDAREKHHVKDVSDDDILDSMVLAVAARKTTLRTVPGAPDDNEPRIYYPEPKTGYLEAESV